MKRMQKGFTLIEVIGVMFIIAILATAIAPSVIQQIDRTRNDVESNSLQNIAELIEVEVQRNQVVPSRNTWVDNIDDHFSGPSNELSEVGNGERVLHTNVDGNTGGDYDQQSLFEAGPDPIGNLSTTAPNVRTLLVSNIDQDLPNGNLNASDFDAAWSQSGSVPSGYVEEEPVHIQRINFSSLFVGISFNRAAGDTKNQASWGLVNSTTDRSITGSSTVYLLKGSQVRLLDASVQEHVVILERPMNFTYDNGAWSW